ncbi:MAG: alpha/beta hydrolase [Sulfurovum sp.]|nr:alpha/beta hydrolase [Sulfurovum sp.]
MMKKILKRISFLILFMYVSLGLYLFFNQSSFLYFPTTDKATKHESFSFQNGGERIHVIKLNPGYSKAILYFGGNAESMAGSADYIAGQFPKFTVYLMDYRGYGASSGEASEAGLDSDALKLYDSIKGKHTSISIGGRSLGTGIATYVASKREVAKLALITPYDSILNVAQGMYPLYPVSLLLNDSYDSLARVKDIKAHVLIIMAEHDKVVLRERTENLIHAFKQSQVEVVVIKNRGHIDISSDKRYYKIMQEFIGN